MSTLHPDPTQLLKDWLSHPDVQAKFRAISDRAMDFLWSDLKISVPYLPEERQDGFASWLKSHQERYVEYLHEEFEREFPGIEKHLTDPLGLWDFIVQGIWDDISLEMQRYAIRGHAFAWVRERYRDTVYPGKPEFEPSSESWSIQLLQKENPDSLGEIIFNKNGDCEKIDVSIAPREPRTERQKYKASRRTVA